MNFWENLYLHQTKFFVILLLLVMSYWLTLPEEEISQPTITLRYRCEIIIKNSHEFSKDVIDNCKKMLKEENEIESD